MKFLNTITYKLVIMQVKSKNFGQIMEILMFLFISMTSSFASADSISTSTVAPSVEAPILTVSVSPTNSSSESHSLTTTVPPTTTSRIPTTASVILTTLSSVNVSSILPTVFKATTVAVNTTTSLPLTVSDKTTISSVKFLPEAESKVRIKKSTRRSKKYEPDINYDKLLKVSRAVTAYTKCFVDMGPCTRNAEIIKAKLSQALIMKCETVCTPYEKLILTKYLQYLKEMSDQLNEFKAKYDPTKNLVNLFLDAVKLPDLPLKYASRRALSKTKARLAAHEARMAVLKKNIADTMDKQKYSISDVNFDLIHLNEKLLEAHTKCFIGSGPCSEEQKKILEQLKTNCDGCSPQEKEQLSKYKGYVRNHSNLDINKSFMKKFNIKKLRSRN